MKLEELIQKLEAANPWTVERVEPVLRAKLVKIDSTKTFVVYTANRLLYEEGLIVEEVHLRLRVDTNEMIRLIVNLNDEASCFTLDRIKRTYPDIEHDPYGLSVSHDAEHSPNGSFGYWTKRPWGHIDFGFKERRPDCLSGITFIPTGKE